ncbi:hypothetical protein HNQ80_002061 [Anaerosolibacter carboniphilus]|uniref:Lipoprotein n=1 Tax=Anaerosolibacter carboniphilus TaxID=1417629 RepID=A0A841KVC6_9FIRM|nr:hypothetical protein [Anaerosolibacter carboniphilus]MBB6215970.1 hypothetical protein [Anaerosolibacter carboniphilus]
MKKYSMILLVLILTASLISCRSSDTNNRQYIKEFPYLPAYGNMKFVKFEKATADGIDRATYTVSNTNPEEFLSGYEQHLTENGWKNTLDNKPISINMEKENHKAIILVTPEEKAKNLTVIIFSN